MAKGDKEQEPSDVIGGVLNLFGLKIDLGELLESPEKLTGRLEGLREKLKEAGGKEVLSDEVWSQGGASVSGHVRIRGLQGEEEYHIGTAGRQRARDEPASTPPEVVEPPIDVFDEANQVTIAAEVPGVSLEDLELKVEGSALSIATKPTARRGYRKELRLEAELEPESLQSTCHNGVLEVHVRKKGQVGP